MKVTSIVSMITNTTFERGQYEEKLDWISASQPLLTFISDYDVHPTLGLSSGHKPITFNLPIGAEDKPISPRLSYNFKTADWSRFRAKLDEKLKRWTLQLQQSSNSADIEEYTKFITNSITTSTEETIRLSTHRNPTYTISEATKRLIRLKHQSYRRWKKTVAIDDKQRYYDYKVLLANSLRNDRRSYYKQLMSSLCNKQMYSDAVWLTVRKFHNKRIKQSYSGTMEYKNEKAVTNAEKADLFAEYFEREVYFEAEDSLPYHDYIYKTNQQNPPEYDQANWTYRVERNYNK